MTSDPSSYEVLNLEIVTANSLKQIHAAVSYLICLISQTKTSKASQSLFCISLISPLLYLNKFVLPFASFHDHNLFGFIYLVSWLEFSFIT